MLLRTCRQLSARSAFHQLANSSCPPRSPSERCAVWPARADCLLAAAGAPIATHRYGHSSSPQSPDQLCQRPTEPATDRAGSAVSVEKVIELADSNSASPGSHMLGKLLSSVKDLVAAVAGESEFARGGLTLALAGAAAATARVASGALFEYCKRKVLVRVEIDSRDDAYRWMMLWLMQQPDFCRSPVISVSTSLKTFGTSPVEESAMMQQHNKNFMLLPAPGDHLMWYRGVPVMVSRQRATGNPQLAANTRLMLETMRLIAPSGARRSVEAMLEEARAHYQASQSHRTSVYKVDPDGYWEKAGSRPVRPLSSVFLPCGVAESVASDCREFLSSEAWYAHRGIPYRRGYLLYGLPGTGKTSLVTALAGELGCHLYVVSLSSPSMTDESLSSLLNSSEEGSILLLEDVDAAFLQRERVGGHAAATSSGGGGLSFSGLLNAIDGVAAQEGRMLFMTTNHIERLSKALIRPGRVDVRVEFTWATARQKEDLFVSFFRDDLLLHRPAAAVTDNAATLTTSAAAPAPDHTAAAAAAGPEAGGSATAAPKPLQPAAAAAALGDSEDAERRLRTMARDFVSHLGEAEISMARLQGYLMRHKSDPAQAIKNCETLLAAQQASDPM